MTVVIDASVVVAALVRSDSVGTWADGVLAGEPLAAPHSMLVEVANVLRRGVANKQLPAEVATMAHQDLLRLPVDLFGYEPFAERVWQLRHNVTAYDGWYVAVAEALDAPVATLDERLAAAQGPTCAFLTPSLRPTRET